MCIRDRDPLHALLALRREGEAPSFMAFALGTVTIGLVATGATRGERARQQIRRDGKVLEGAELLRQRATWGALSWDLQS